MGFWLKRLRLARVLLRSGRLAWKLVRDPRTPLTAKLILAAAVLYAFSPLDFMPDFVPVLGQLDDVAVLALGLELFFKNVPPWLKAEHEATLGRTREGGKVIEHDPPRREPR